MACSTRLWKVGWNADGLQPGRQVTGQLGVDNGAEDGHAEHGAHLPTRVGGRGGHAGSFREAPRVRGTDVTGTNSMPIPMPASGRTQPRVPKSTVGDSTVLATRIPPPASRHPIVIGQRGPIRATNGPGECGGEDQPGRHRQEIDRRLVGGGVGDDLEVQRREEEDGEGAEVRRRMRRSWSRRTGAGGTSTGRASGS